MKKIKFNTTTSNFTLILIFLLFNLLFSFALYCLVVNNIYDFATIFYVVLFVIADVIFLFYIFQGDDSVQELSINENYVIFRFNGIKKQVKTIKLENIKNFHVDIYIKRSLKCVTYYINFYVKLKGSDETQKLCTNDYCIPKGICSLFDIQEMIPNFTYNITSNEERFKNSLLYYAENKKFSDTDIKIQNNLKKVVIILLVVASMILIPMIYSIVIDFINMQ